MTHFGSISPDRDSSHLRKFHADHYPDPPPSQYQGSYPRGGIEVLAVVCAVMLLIAAIGAPTIVILTLLGVIHD